MNFVCRLAIPRKSDTELLMLFINEIICGLQLVMLSHSFKRMQPRSQEKALGTRSPKNFVLCLGEVPTRVQHYCLVGSSAGTVELDEVASV